MPSKVVGGNAAPVDIHLDATYFTLLKEPHNPAELDPGMVTLVEEFGMPTGIRDIVIKE